MKNRSYKRGGDIASTIGIGEEEDNSLMKTVTDSASALKDKVMGLFSGGGKSRRVRFSMKKRKSVKRKSTKSTKKKSTKRKTNKRKSSKRKY